LKRRARVKANQGFAALRACLDKPGQAQFRQAGAWLRGLRNMLLMIKENADSRCGISEEFFMKLSCKSLILASMLALAGGAAAIAQAPAGQIPAAAGQNAAAAPTVAALSQSAKADSIVAVLDGKNMTLAQLDNWAKLINPSPDMPVDQRRLQVLRLLVTMQAFSDAAKAQKLDASPEFQQKMDLMKESVLQQAYIDKTIMTAIPDSELKARYNKEAAAIPPEPEIHAEHILVKTRAEAEDIIRQLGKGADFEKLAKEKSIDGTASLGGDLGYFTQGQMVDAFDKAAFALKKGEYTKKPVQTQFGWHVIKVLDIRKKQPPTFDEMKLYLQNVIMRERYQQEQRKVLGQFKASYPNAGIAKAMALPALQDDGAVDDD